MVANANYIRRYAMIVQGDVFLIRSYLPEGAQIRKKSSNGYVIAIGEATGHSHVIADEIELYEVDGTLYIRAERETSMHHEEHAPVYIPSGVWKVGIVREYDVFRPDHDHIVYD